MSLHEGKSSKNERKNEISMELISEMTIYQQFPRVSDFVLRPFALTFSKEIRVY